jgi:PIN domain nuclease of toxin-antitoxin system
VNLLLDTHALLWWLADVELTTPARAAIADPENLVVVSAASVWEASIKRALGKLDAPGGLADVVVTSGFEPLAITHAHADAAGELPPHHRDPFDRMLVAQARTEGLTIVTRDRAFDDYDVARMAC